jgi:hypothetical protein
MHVRFVEAAVAAITLDFVHQAARMRGRLEAVLTAVRKMLDAFVSYRMRLAMAQAEHVRPRQLQGMPSPSINAK